MVEGAGGLSEGSEGDDADFPDRDPPYDSTPAQWKRYIDLCGPIDEEIFTPELVREKSLCPHEDYVYFNWPAKEELEEIRAYQENTAKVWDALLRGEAFTRMIATTGGFGSRSNTVKNSWTIQNIFPPCSFSARPRGFPSRPI